MGWVALLGRATQPSFFLIDFQVIIKKLKNTLIGVAYPLEEIASFSF